MRDDEDVEYCWYPLYTFAVPATSLDLIPSLLFSTIVERKHDALNVIVAVRYLWGDDA